MNKLKRSCKSAGYSFAGSNPALPIFPPRGARYGINAGVVENLGSTATLSERSERESPVPAERSAAFPQSRSPRRIIHSTAVRLLPDAELNAALAIHATSPKDATTGEKFSTINAFWDELQELTSQVAKGDTEHLERVAISQITVLDTLFNSLVQGAWKNYNNPHFDKMLKLGLPATSLLCPAHTCFSGVGIFDSAKRTNVVPSSGRVFAGVASNASAPSPPPPLPPGSAGGALFTTC
jgi:hypothetical protein